MKLTKNNLIRITKNGLHELGYNVINDTITPAQGLYIKQIGSEFYLTLGLIISNYYNNVFTASYYLSRSTAWALLGEDIPKESYERVGFFLKKEEREILLESTYSKKGVNDAWWDLENEKALKHFIETVKITEERFLGQSGLFDQIRNSAFINELAELVKKVICIVVSNNIKKETYQFIPQKPIDEIPIKWFKAAEEVIKNEKATLNINTVKRLAADAWRQTLISNPSLAQK